MVRMFLAALYATIASPALAQLSDAAVPDPEEARDGWTVAGGVGMTADYEGSDDYRLIPAAALRGTIGNVSISTRGLYLYADVIRMPGKLDLDVGPIVGLRMNRSGKIKDDVVDLLPERNRAIEVGGFAGLSVTGLTNPYDTLGIRLDVVKDVADAHRSTIFTPTAEFTTPLSRRMFVGASLSADYVGDRYADYYFSVSPADALTSGLPVFDADGGMKNWKVGLLANFSLSGDLRRGWSLFGLANRSQLLGDFRRSPIVAQRGSAGQWFGAIGVGYSW